MNLNNRLDLKLIHSSSYKAQIAIRKTNRFKYKISILKIFFCLWLNLSHLEANQNFNDFELNQNDKIAQLIQFADLMNSSSDRASKTLDQNSSMGNGNLEVMHGLANEKLRKFPLINNKQHKNETELDSMDNVNIDKNLQAKNFIDSNDDIDKIRNQIKIKNQSDLAQKQALINEDEQEKKDISNLYGGRRKAGDVKDKHEMKLKQVYFDTNNELNSAYLIKLPFEPASKSIDYHKSPVKSISIKRPSYVNVPKIETFALAQSRLHMPQTVKFSSPLKVDNFHEKLSSLALIKSPQFVVGGLSNGDFSNPTILKGNFLQDAINKPLRRGNILRKFLIATKQQNRNKRLKQDAISNGNFLINTTPMKPHDTSDWLEPNETSDFPIYEAISGQASQPPAGLETSGRTSGSRPEASFEAGQCNRPRHIIQADRSVVDHILQSQQNFVIARVPIKKVSTTQAASVKYQTSTSETNRNNFQSYHIPFPVPLPLAQFPLQMTPITIPFVNSNNQQAASLIMPQYLNGNNNPAFTITSSSNQVPNFQPNQATIQLATTSSINRPSVLQTIANFVSGLRSQAPKRPNVSLMAGSAPASIYIPDGNSVILTRRQDIFSHRQQPQQSKLFKFKPNFSFLQNLFKSKENIISTAPTSTQMTDLISNESFLHQASNHLVTTSAQSNQIDPMQRLLMLKTSTDNEICTPISSIGIKIKYSCVPNYCLKLALTNSDTTNVNVNQFNPSSAYHDTFHTNASYKASNSMQDFSMDQPNLKHQIQVQQIEHYPTNQPQLPLVTYTHLNAYDMPKISQFVQPQHHQQFLTTSQNLNALANNENLYADPESLYPFNSASMSNENNLRGFVTTTNTRNAWNGIQSTRAPNHSKQQQSSITFGTAFIRTSPSPSNLRDQQIQSQQQQINHRPQPSPSFGQFEDNDDSPISNVNEPNEFLSAVDERLERPIRLPQQTGNNNNKRKLKERNLPTSNVNDYDSFKLRARQKLNNNDDNNNNNNIHIKSFKQAKQNFNEQNKGENQLERISPHLMKQSDKDETHLNSDYEDQQNGNSNNNNNEDDYSADYDSNLNEPIENGRKIVNSQRDTNATKNFGGYYQPEAANSRERKIRRHNLMTTNINKSPLSSISYGLRQSAQLPAPEKSLDDLNNNNNNYLSNQDEDLSNMTNSQMDSPDNQNCDCLKNPTTNNLTNNQTKHQQIHLQDINLNPSKSNETYLMSSKNDFVSSNLDKVPSSLMQQDQLMKDRREAQQQSFQTNSFKSSFTTKKPYNLRNTTYKNMQLSTNLPPLQSNNFIESNQMSLVESSSFSNGNYPNDTITTTTKPATKELQSFKSFNANNQTQFDDSLKIDPLIEKQELNLEKNEFNKTDDLTNENFLKLVNDKENEGEFSNFNKYPAFNTRRQQRNKNFQTFDSRNSSNKPNSINEIISNQKETRENSDNDRNPQIFSASNRTQTDRLMRSAVSSQADKDNDTDNEDLNPHQYQIQIRWKNSSSIENLPVNDSNKVFELNKMKENVQDKLFEHKEEEHLHDKIWFKQKLNSNNKNKTNKRKRKKLVNGKWIIINDSDNDDQLREFDFGPNGNERETPIKDQLSHEAGDKEIASHFAIPTKNFRQSAKFVEWAQRSVNMKDELSEPSGKKRRRKKKRRRRKR